MDRKEWSHVADRQSQNLANVSEQQPNSLAADWKLPPSHKIAGFVAYFPSAGSSRAQDVEARQFMAGLLMGVSTINRSRLVCGYRCPRRERCVQDTIGVWN
jgi:hypothetical protein